MLAAGEFLFDLRPYSERPSGLLLDVHFFDERDGFCIGKIEKDTVYVHRNVLGAFGSFVSYIYEQKVLRSESETMP